MIPLLVATALITALITGVAAAVIMLHGYRLELSGRRRVRVVEPARGQLIAVLADPDPELAVAALSRLRSSERASLLVELAAAVHGHGREALRVAADRVGLRRSAERACRSIRRARRLAGVRILALLGGHSGIVQQLLSDRAPEVRAEAAAWAGESKDGRAIGGLIAMLDDPSPLCRAAAHDALARIGLIAVPPLVVHLAEAAASRSVVGGLCAAAELADPRFLAPALLAADNSDPLTRRAAADLLGVLGGPEAEEGLAGLLRDSDPRVRTSAAEALGQLRSSLVLDALVPLLSDQSFTVRMAAAVALRRAGPRGDVVLTAAEAAGIDVAAHVRALDPALLPR